jgi:hypothetical protein
MGNLQGHQPPRCSFESFNYFKDKRYMACWGSTTVHPLVRLNDFSKQNEGNFYAQEFAVFSKMQKTTVVIPCSSTWPTRATSITIPRRSGWRCAQRLRQHILNSAGKQDYDVLQFNSNGG